MFCHSSSSQSQGVSGVGPNFVTRTDKKGHRNRRARSSSFSSGWPGSCNARGTMNNCAVSPVTRPIATAETLATPELWMAFNRNAILELAFKRGIWNLTFGGACKTDVYTKYKHRASEPGVRARVVARPPVTLCAVGT